MNILDYVTSLTTAEARTGQNTKVKANKRTVGKSFITGSGTPKTLSLGINTEIGVLDQISTITEKVGTANVLKRYGKILLDEPYYDDTENLISYLWFALEDLDFVISPTAEVKPVVNSTALSPLYAITVGGSRLRSTASALNLNNLIRLVPYGDLVGYTDGTTQKYLSVSFLKIYNAKGVATGWIGANNVSKTKPQSKAVPKEAAIGITQAEDPQGANVANNSLSFTNILFWTIGFMVLFILSVFGIRKYQTYKNKRKEVRLLNGRE